jgi:hypothetical protein
MSEHASKRGDLPFPRMLRVYKRKGSAEQHSSPNLLALIKKFTSCIRSCSTRSKGKRVVVFAFDYTFHGIPKTGQIVQSFGTGSLLKEQIA